MTAMSMPLPSEQRRRWPRVTKAQRAAFLEAVAAGMSFTHAAKQAGRHRGRFYDLADVDEAFAAEWAEAGKAGLDVLIDEARRRAVVGVEKPVYQGGQLVGAVTEYSDSLLMFLIKQRDPSFRENHRLELTGRDGGPVEIAGDYTPTTLLDVMRLARELGVEDVIDGEAVEVEPAAIEERAS